jgi:predicted HD phosphohydrolase
MQVPVHKRTTAHDAGRAASTQQFVTFAMLHDMLHLVALQGCDHARHRLAGQ